jgi:uncharacterized coiled-coil protein SlyX
MTPTEETLTKSVNVQSRLDALENRVVNQQKHIEAMAHQLDRLQRTLTAHGARIDELETPVISGIRGERVGPTPPQLFTDARKAERGAPVEWPDGKPDWLLAMEGK